MFLDIRKAFPIRLYNCHLVETGRGGEFSLTMSALQWSSSWAGSGISCWMIGLATWVTRWSFLRCVEMGSLVVDSFQFYWKSPRCSAISTGRRLVKYWRFSSIPLNRMETFNVHFFSRVIKPLGHRSLSLSCKSMWLCHSMHNAVPRYGECTIKLEDFYEISKFHKNLQ